MLETNRAPFTGIGGQSRGTENRGFHQGHPLQGRLGQCSKKATPRGAWAGPGGAEAGARMEEGLCHGMAGAWPWGTGSPGWLATASLQETLS